MICDEVVMVPQQQRPPTPAKYGGKKKRQGRRARCCPRGLIPNNPKKSQFELNAPLWVSRDNLSRALVDIVKG